MPTHPQAFVEVANALNGAPLPQQVDAATDFFTRALPKWREDARAVIFDFLVACAEPPTSDELHALIDLVGTAESPKRLPAEIIDLDRAREQPDASKRVAHARKSGAARKSEATTAPRALSAQTAHKNYAKTAAKRTVLPKISASRQKATTTRPPKPAPGSRSR
jgi:hypothetical protein